MSPPTDFDKNQTATPYKLEKARERGQVAKSQDIVGAVVFTVAVLYLSWQGWATWREQFRLDQAIMLQATGMVSNPAKLWPLLERVIQSTLFMAGPYLVMLVLAAILANVMQIGPVMSFRPIKPDWERINPANGFKKVFSFRTIFLGFRAILKLFILTLVVYFSLKHLLPQFYHLAGLSPLATLRTLIDDFGSLGIKLALALAFIAIIDLIYSRYEFAKKMRMSHREIRDELKHREGDPRIRARLRQLRREMLKRSLSLRKTSEADVVITNPTHVAVALRYIHGQMTSPQLIAKGKGHMAAAMRQIAARYRIPVVQNPTLARTLYQRLSIDNHVPPELYSQVARIIVWIFARRNAIPLRHYNTQTRLPGRTDGSAHFKRKGKAWRL